MSNLVSQTIIEVLEVKGNSQRVITDLNSPRSVWVHNDNITGNTCVAANLSATKPQLTPFWQDVKSRIGMDVCTPFMKCFPGHSFVAYDNGLVWSKTLKVGFNSIQGKTISRNEMPKSLTEYIGFGGDFSHLQTNSTHKD